MSDPTSLARSARESLAKGLNALQADASVPRELVELGAPIAQALGALHSIERSQGAELVPHAEVAINAVRLALGQLQAQSNPHPAVLAAMEAVAASLGMVHSLSKLAGGPSAAPPKGPPPVHTSPMANVPAASASSGGPPRPGQNAAPRPGGTGPQPGRAQGQAPAQPQPAPAQPVQSAPNPQPVHAPAINAGPPPGVQLPPQQMQPGYAPTMGLGPPPGMGPPMVGAPGAFPPPQQMQPQQMQPQQMQPQQMQPQQMQPQQMQPQQMQPQQMQPQQMQPQQMQPQQMQPQQMQPQQMQPQQMQPQQMQPQQMQQGDPFAGRASPVGQAPSPGGGPSGGAPGGAPGGPGPVVDAALGAHSATNFYKGLSGNDIIDHGGLFVATYMIPKIGSALRLRVSLPGGYEFEAAAIVKWAREAADPFGDAQPGFGARFTQISQEARQLVYRYVRNREPLFHDDL